MTPGDPTDCPDRGKAFLSLRRNRGVTDRPQTFEIGGETTVDRLGFGGIHLCGANALGDPPDPAAARAIVARARELGVSLIDTSDAYGPGTSERLIREAIDTSADDVVIATKGGHLRNTDGEWPTRGDPAHLHNAVLQSLDRLGVDTIDCYQLHKPDPAVPIEDSMTELAALQDEGLIQHLGVSTVTVEQLDRARDVADVATVQNEFNVVERSQEPVLRACEDAGIGFIPYAPLNRGVLEDRGEDLRAVADNHDATVTQVAIAWLLQYADVTLPIPGTSNRQHLEENVAATGLELTDAEMARLSA
jgi:aryl-alcohol dehydrogenase-like predicted oxidoreductase